MCRRLFTWIETLHVTWDVRNYALLKNMQPSLNQNPFHQECGQFSPSSVSNIAAISIGAEFSWYAIDKCWFAAEECVSKIEVSYSSRFQFHSSCASAELTLDWMRNVLNFWLCDRGLSRGDTLNPLKGSPVHSWMLVNWRRTWQTDMLRSLVNLDVEKWSYTNWRLIDDSKFSVHEDNLYE